MQDHRQAGAPGQFELGGVEVRLARPVQPWHKVIEADLAHRHQVRVISVPGQRVGQVVNIVIGGLADPQRVDAQRVAQAVAVGQRTQRVEVRHRHRRQHQHRHTGRLGAGQHGAPVGVELGRVEMAVGVDPGHRRMMPARRLAA